MLPRFSGCPRSGDGAPAGSMCSCSSTSCRCSMVPLPRSKRASCRRCSRKNLRPAAVRDMGDAGRHPHYALLFDRRLPAVCSCRRYRRRSRTRLYRCATRTRLRGGGGGWRWRRPPVRVSIGGRWGGREQVESTGCPGDVICTFGPKFPLRVADTMGMAISNNEALHRISMLADPAPVAVRGGGGGCRACRARKGTLIVELGDDGFTYFPDRGGVAGVPPTALPQRSNRTSIRCARLRQTWRPRIFRVTAMSRVRGPRIPDIVLTAAGRNASA